MIPQEFMQLLEKLDTDELSVTDNIRLVLYMDNKECREYFEQRKQLVRHLRSLPQPEWKGSIVDSMVLQLADTTGVSLINESISEGKNKGIDDVQAAAVTGTTWTMPVAADPLPTIVVEPDMEPDVEPDVESNATAQSDSEVKPELNVLPDIDSNEYASPERLAATDEASVAPVEQPATTPIVEGPEARVEPEATSKPEPRSSRTRAVPMIIDPFAADVQHDDDLERATYTQAEAAMLTSSPGSRKDRQQKKRRLIWISSSSAVAACLLLLVFLYPEMNQLFRDSQQSPNGSVSEQKKVESKLYVQNKNQSSDPAAVSANGEGTEANSAAAQPDADSGTADATEVAESNGADGDNGSEDNAPNSEADQPIDNNQSGATDQTGNTNQTAPKKPAEPVKPTKPTQPTKPKQETDNSGTGQNSNANTQTNNNTNNNSNNSNTGNNSTNTNNTNNSSDGKSPPAIDNDDKSGETNQGAGGGGLAVNSDDSNGNEVSYQAGIEGNRVVIRTDANDVVYISKNAPQSDGGTIELGAWQVQGKVYRYSIEDSGGKQTFEIDLSEDSEIKVSP